MKPDTSNQNQSGGGLQPASVSSSGGQPTQPTPQPTTHQAAAVDVLRSKIDTLYGDQPLATMPEVATDTVQTIHGQQEATSSNPYLRQHSEPALPQQDEWQAYHSAWQNYYQKYYASYYQEQVAQVQRSVRSATPEHYFGSTPTDDIDASQPISDAQPLSKEEALQSLRQRLLARVQESAQTVRKSRHFIPIASAITVVLVFLFIQYNSFVFATVASYVSPGSIDPQNIIINPDTNVAVSQDPKLIIPKINVDVPVNYDVGADYDSQMEAMRTGVAHFSIPGASSHPGEIGNTVIAGHSSNDLFDTGDYKFIFAQLERLQTGDTIYAHYQGIRYTYVITKKQIVKPTDISALVYETTKPVITLVTCTPLGTSIDRLFVIGEQVSPDPAAAKAVATTTTNSDTTNLPGNERTLFEKLFGGGN